MRRARTRLPDPSLRSPRVSPHLGTGAAPSSSTYGTAGRETGKSHPTSPILKGQVREPPDIAQPHCITHHGEDEIQLAGPVPSGFVFIPYIVFLKGEKKRRGKIGKQPRWQTTIAISGCPQGKGGGGCGATCMHPLSGPSPPPPPSCFPWGEGHRARPNISLPKLQPLQCASLARGGRGGGSGEGGGAARLSPRSGILTAAVPGCPRGSPPAPAGSVFYPEKTKNRFREMKPPHFSFQDKAGSAGR